MSVNAPKEDINLLKLSPLGTTHTPRESPTLPTLFSSMNLNCRGNKSSTSPLNHQNFQGQDPTSLLLSDLSPRECTPFLSYKPGFSHPKDITVFQILCLFSLYIYIYKYTV